MAKIAKFPFFTTREVFFTSSKILFTICNTIQFHNNVLLLVFFTILTTAEFEGFSKNEWSLWVTCPVNIFLKKKILEKMSDGSYALDLLENKNDWKKPFLTDIWSPMLCGMLGFGAACFINFGTRRPIFSGMEISRKKVLHK